MTRRLSFPLVMLMGFVLMPVVIVVKSIAFGHGVERLFRALHWMQHAHRRGLTCPAGHTRPLLPTDRWLCAECNATFQGYAYMPCPHCGGGEEPREAASPPWVTCDCGLAVPVPPIPTAALVISRTLRGAIRAEGGHHG